MDQTEPKKGSGYFARTLLVDFSSPTMSCLPTPPRTNHRGLSWDAHLNRIHLFSDDYPASLLLPSSKRLPPKKSILKPCNPLPFCDEDASSSREETPEPQDPPSNLTYLQSPIDTIYDESSDLRTITQAWSVLAARLRSSVPDNGEVDASWPLFQPMRRDLDRLTSKMCLDLGKALIDPCASEPQPKFPPSPRQSPKKLNGLVKKSGLTAEQAKHGRDLCTTSHSVLKLLTFLFATPSLYSMFENSQLDSVLAQVLCILSKPSLPTPHARKTWALCIWVLQTQRLPEKVLEASKDRIAYVISRGIDGELGKEGKKGARADGLRAIHDLCLYLPTVFVPAFSQIFASIIPNVISTSPQTRLLAGQAIGALAKGLADLPEATQLRWSIARQIQHIIWDDSPLAAPASPVKTKTGLSSPTTTTSQHTSHEIIRSLRSTLLVDVPTHAGTSPIWGLSLLASLIVLLAPIIRLSSSRSTSSSQPTTTDRKVFLTVQALLTLALRAKKTSLKEFCSLISRTLVWVYVSPQLEGAEPEEDDGEDEVVESPFQDQPSRDRLLELILSSTDCGNGITFAYSLLSMDDSDRSTAVDTALRVFIVLAKREQEKGRSAVTLALLKRLLGLTGPSKQLEEKTLVPESMFSLPAQFLSLDYASVNFIEAVRDVIAECYGPSDLPSLRKDEIVLDCEKSQEDISKDYWHSLVEIFVTALPGLKDKSIPTMLDVFKALLEANVDFYQESANTEGLSFFTQTVFEIIARIALDQELDLAITSASLTSGTRSYPPPLVDSLGDTSSLCSTPGLRRLSLFRLLLNVAKSVIPPIHIREQAIIVGENLGMMRKANVGSGSGIPIASEEDDERRLWALACADVLCITGEDALSAVARLELDSAVLEPSQKRDVWRVACERVLISDAHWEIGTALMGLPFTDYWLLNADDYNLFDSLLSRTKEQAIDFGLDMHDVLESLCSSAIAEDTFELNELSSPRLIDLIVSSIDSESKSISYSVLKLVNLVLVRTYTVASQTECMWMIRSLANLFDTVIHQECFEALLEHVKEGVEVWLEDSMLIIDNSTYMFDIERLYGVLLAQFKILPRTLGVLQELEDLIAAPLIGRKSPLGEMGEFITHFSDFWQETFVHVPEPEQGWPKKIEACLRIVAGDYSEVHADDLPSVSEPAAVSTDVTVIEVPSRPCTPPSSGQKIFSPVITLTGSPSLATPSTPTSIARTWFTPTTPRSPPKRSIAYSYGGHDKENMSPLVRTPTVRNGLKRKSSGDPEEEEEEGSPSRRSIKLTRRMKKRQRNSSSSEDERAVENALLVVHDLETTIEVPRVEAASTGIKRKRIMDCVEVPIPRSPQLIHTHPLLQGSKVGPPRGLRRVVSAPLVNIRRSKRSSVIHASNKSSWIQTNARERSPSPEPIPERRRTRSMTAADSLESVSTPVHNSGPTARATKRRRLNSHTPQEELPSSDDDPHFGQVTPHHLISPAVCSRHEACTSSSKKMKSLLKLKGDVGDESEDEDDDYDDIPSSDDSFVPPSPSKQAVERRFLRTSSGNLLKTLSL
jgi:hypothetical protein